MSHCLFDQLLSDLDLLGRYVLFRACPCIKLGDIIGLALNVIESNFLPSIVSAVVKVKELHMHKFFVA